MKKSIISLITLILVSSSANALVEVRALYGLLTAGQNLSSVYTTSSSIPSIVPYGGIGADVLVKIPLIPIGFGLRYEKMSFSASAGSLSFESEFTRNSLVLNYRLIDTLLYLGPIFTYGLSHTGEMKVKNSNSTVVNYSSSSMSSYSVGLEAGVKLLLFTVGAEVGYQNFPWKNAKDSAGTMGNQDLAMGGNYAKIAIGFGI